MTDAAMIDALWERRADLTPDHHAEKAAVDAVLDALDSGAVRIAEPGPDSQWIVHQWLKKAVLLSFRLNGNVVVDRGAGGYDKVPLKCAGWSAARHAEAGFRMAPGAVVRRGAFIDKNVVLMPSFVNIGAHIGEGAMIDTWATVGSCAQIGRNVHISGGAGIGGVLEPLQANPVIIEDDCFIGARAEVAEGVIVRQGAVLSMGVYLGASTKIVDRETGEIFRGEVPAYCVVVPGTLGGGNGAPALYCAVIVKRVDAQTRAKTAINELLRD